MNRSSSLIISSSSSSSKPQVAYDVFLSFRGEDTRYSFTSFLYKTLCEKGIDTFLDDDRLEKGKSISPELLESIESSRCSIIVISENYASSSWCLDELVKIIQCMKAYKQIVLPIFYHVDPSEVRKQSGCIGEAFKKHEQDHDLEKVQSWRDALKEVGNLAGWHLQRHHDEPNFIHDFVVKVSNKVGIARLNILEDLFGMESRLEELHRCVCTASQEGVSFVGICGLGGNGKTTLARAYYEWMSSANKFRYCSFLANIRENCEKKEDGLVYLQNLLLSNILKGSPKKIENTHEGKNMIKGTLSRKKALIVLDDVDKLDQLEALAGKDNWFGPGSRILITTRDNSLLTSTYEKPEKYETEQLNYSESLQLFCNKAFKSVEPSDGYKELSNQVMEYAKGLPLALKVLGSFLCGKTREQWRDALKRLEEYPNKEIFKVLRISFDGLEETEKSIFLDVACFFNGVDKDEIIHIMDIRGFYPLIGIRNLLEKSLLNDGPHNTLRIHDLLQEMGREIVREKSRNEPGQWSRLWKWEDMHHVLENNTGTKEVEAIVLPKIFQDIDWKAISEMRKLRLLMVSGNQLSDDKKGLQYLSNELLILRWHGFHFTCLPSSFQPIKLFELILPESRLHQLWIEPMKPLYNLKIINLSNSRNFRKLGDFRVVPNLEKLNLTYCGQLQYLPPSITGLKYLKVLKLFGCSNLRNLPEGIGHLNSLEKLDLSSTDSLEDIPASIALLKKLNTLHLANKPCPLFFQKTNSQSSYWRNIIQTIGGTSLKKLDLCHCGLVDGQIPDDLGCLVSLQVLDLSDNSFSCLPACVNRLLNLRILDLRSCRKLKSLGPEFPPSLEMVMVDRCISLNTFQDPLDDQYCNLQFSATCSDCFELVRRQGSKRTAFTSLKRFLQSLPYPSRRFEIVLPGNEIPNWFTYRSSGRLIIFQLDPNWCNTKWKGFAFCVSSPKIVSYVKCISVRINGKELALVKYPDLILKNLKNHIWVFYLPRDYVNFDTECHEISFEVTNPKIGCECGFRLVYEEDIQYLNLHRENEDVDVEYLLRKPNQLEVQLSRTGPSILRREDCKVIFAHCFLLLLLWISNKISVVGNLSGTDV